jgi:hypothetical protein
MQGCKYITDLKITLLIEQESGRWGFNNWVIYVEDAPKVVGKDTIEDKYGIETKLNRYPLKTCSSEKGAKEALTIIIRTQNRNYWNMPILSTGQHIYLEVKPTSAVLENVYKQLGIEL